MKKKKAVIKAKRSNLDKEKLVTFRNNHLFNVKTAKPIIHFINCNNKIKKEKL